MVNDTTNTTKNKITAPTDVDSIGKLKDVCVCVCVFKKDEHVVDAHLL